MISNEKAKEYFKAHAALTKCEICKAVDAEKHFMTTCSCGWSLNAVILESDNPDGDVVLITIVEWLANTAWDVNICSPRTSVGKLYSCFPPVDMAHKIAQVIFGTLDDKVFAIICSSLGARSVGIEFPVKKMSKILETIAEKIEKFDELEEGIPDPIKEACERILDTK